MENNNNDNKYNERVNVNKEFINNDTNINDKNNKKSEENLDKIHIEVTATVICFVVFIIIFRSFVLFLISMLFVILLGENFFKAIGKFVLFSIVVIAIVFGLCLFVAIGASGL